MLKREEVALKIFCAFVRRSASNTCIRDQVKEAYRLADIFIEETAKG